jgi:predicted MFS family arabinose efflux permease
MQKTKFRKLINFIFTFINPLISDSWSKRSVLLLSLLFGYYFTNSILSYLLDKSVNTILLAILILILMELFIRSSLLSKYSKLSVIIISINNFRIGSTYALLLEAFKLGS